MDDSIPEVLRLAAELISDPEAWTTGAFARAADGRSVDPLSEEAVQWDIVGAVMRVTGVSSITRSSPYRSALYAAIGQQGATAWNDQATHGDVLAMLQKAAEPIAPGIPKPVDPTPQLRPSSP